MKNKISALVTTYNRGDILADCVHAITEQTLKPIEIIIIDDGSTDDTDCVVNRLRDAIEIPINYVKQSNSGVSAARNAGFTLAKGDYVACCDDDDLWSPNHLEWVDEAIGLFPTAKVYSGFIGRGFDSDNVVKSDDPNLFSSYDKAADGAYLLRKKREINAPFYTPCFSATVLSKNVLSSIKVDEELKCRQDIDFFWRISEISDIVLHSKIHVNATQAVVSNLSVTKDASPEMQLEIHLKRGYWGSRLMEKTVARKPNSLIFKKILAQSYLGYAHYLYIARRDEEARTYLIKSIKSAFVFNQIKLIIRMVLSIRKDVSSMAAG